MPCAFTKRKGSFWFLDGTTPTPQQFKVPFTEGDLSFDAPQPSQLVVRERGKFTDPPVVMEGEDQAVTFSFSAKLQGITDAAAILLTDMITRNGFFESDWVSTLDPCSDFIGVHAQWQLEGEASGIRFQHCVVTGSIDTSGDFIMINVTGTAYSKKPLVAVALT